MTSIITDASETRRRNMVVFATQPTVYVRIHVTVDSCSHESWCCSLGRASVSCFDSPLKARLGCHGYGRWSGCRLSHPNRRGPVCTRRRGIVLVNVSNLEKVPTVVLINGVATYTAHRLKYFRHEQRGWSFSAPFCCFRGLLPVGYMYF